MSTLKEDAAYLRRVLAPLKDVLGAVCGLILLVAFVVGLGFLGFVFLDFVKDAPMPGIPVRIVE